MVSTVMLMNNITFFIHLSRFKDFPKDKTLPCSLFGKRIGDGVEPTRSVVVQEEVWVLDTKLCCCDEALKVPVSLILVAKTRMHALVWVKRGWI